jgi:hypothetical protein
VGARSGIEEQWQWSLGAERAHAAWHIARNAAHALGIGERGSFRTKRRRNLLLGELATARHHRKSKEQSRILRPFDGQDERPIETIG